MEEIIALVIILFAAYLFLPKTWFVRFAAGGKSTIVSEMQETQASQTLLFIPEDSVLRRHFLAQLRSEIELELSPRPTDSVLQRHYDALVDARLESRLTALIV